MNKHLAKGDWRTANKNMKRCSTSLVIRETQITNKMKDSPGGTVDKYLPATAGDTGLTPGLGRFYMLWTTKPMRS